MPFITNNQAGCMVVDVANGCMPVFVTNESYARSSNPFTWYSNTYQGWHVGDIKGR